MNEKIMDMQNRGGGSSLFQKKVPSEFWLKEISKKINKR
jgi:hypothetical protein